MDEGDNVGERIQALMIEGSLDPTPTTYELLYRAVTGGDPRLAEAIEEARTAPGGLSQRVIALIRRRHYGADGNGLGRLIDDAERQLSQMASVVERSDAHARSYRETLGRSRIDAAETLDRQRAMLAEIVAATGMMIAQTERLQEELGRSSREIDLLKAELEIARTESRSDGLTGLSNRKACCDYLEAQVSLAREGGHPLSLIFLDIDHFKTFNDSHGHGVGDEVLALVGRSLERAFEGLGLVARWGGEEFVVVLPQMRAREAAQHAEAFRRLVSARPMRARQSGREIGRITLSLGVAELGRDDGAEQLVERADNALYGAKAEGRNRVVTWREAA